MPMPCWPSKKSKGKPKATVQVYNENGFEHLDDDCPQCIGQVSSDGNQVTLSTVDLFGKSLQIPRADIRKRLQSSGGSLDSGTDSFTEDELNQFERCPLNASATSSANSSSTNYGRTLTNSTPSPFPPTTATEGGISTSRRWNSMAECLEFGREDFELKWASTSANKSEESTSTISPTDFISHKIIGDGCYGDVLLIQHKVNDQFHAMKVSNKSLAQRRNQLDQLKTEQRLLTCLSGFPFIISLEYPLEDVHSFYSVMEFIPGGDMFHHLRLQGRFTEELTKFYTAQLVLTLEYLHRLEIVYRDIKPENILINVDGYLKLTDFGLAKRLIDGRRSYTFCGTPEYIAPEIILCRGYGKAVDWWALGVLIYEMILGRPPFTGDNPLDIYEKIVSDTNRIYFPKSFSLDLKDLTRNLVQIDLSRRYGNLRNGVDDIKRHKWFAGIDWEAIFRKRVRAPFKPKVNYVGDLQNFEDCR